MSAPPRVLVVEDDEQTVALLRVLLESQGYKVASAGDGDQALGYLEKQVPDLVLLDLMMPHVDGITVCRKLREYSSVPIIVLSALGMEDKKIEALDVGANDYVTKPFSARELMARVRAALRQKGSRARRDPAQRFRAGNLRADFQKREVTIGGTPVHLTQIEYRLLRELARHANEVLTHRYLLSRVWGEAYGDSINYLHIYIGRLRRKLSGLNGAKIVTHAGVGYALSTSAKAAGSRPRRRSHAKAF